MKKNAFGVVDLLLGLLIISIAFIAIMPVMKGFGGGNLKDSSVNYVNIQDEVDKQVQDIMQKRQYTIDNDDYLNRN